MTLVRKLFYGLLGLIILLALIGLLLPQRAHVERSITIQATTSQVFKHINGMKAFHQWSPWTALDPDTNYEFTGPDTGIGSKMLWASGSDQVGQGSQVITAMVENRSVTTELEFGEDAGGSAAFQLQETDAGTHVTWSFYTEFGWDLFSRYVGLFLDKLLGPSYEKGLMNLKAQVEANP
ncbi:MAG: SRPBCC family protein [Chromatiales bacterium]|jgi:hypothetical protein